MTTYATEEVTVQIGYDSKIAGLGYKIRLSEKRPRKHFFYEPTRKDGTKGYCWIGAKSLGVARLAAEMLQDMADAGNMDERCFEQQLTLLPSHAFITDNTPRKKKKKDPHEDSVDVFAALATAASETHAEIIRLPLRKAS